MSELHEKIERVEKIDSEESSLVNEKVETKERVAPDKEQFDALMNLDKQRAPTAEHVKAQTSASLMDQIRDIGGKVEGVKRASPDQIVAQAQEVIRQIEDVKSKLATPDLELKSSVQTLLKNKLGHIDEGLKVAMNRVGVEYVPQDATASKSKVFDPIERFLGFLTHGQNQLQRLSGEVQTMHLNREDISPASMLAIQIKVGYIQQEVEFFANVLNKSLESIKTIMNVQI